jgi:predicted ABC-type transport system involved in lysophospholipase L1 biosynthesis ATPase subunit
LKERKKIISYLFDKNNEWTLIVISNDTSVVSAAEVCLKMSNGKMEQVVVS